MRQKDEGKKLNKKLPVLNFSASIFLPNLSYRWSGAPSDLRSVELLTIVSRKAAAAGVFRVYLFSDTHPQLALCGSLNQRSASRRKIAQIWLNLNSMASGNRSSPPIRISSCSFLPFQDVIRWENWRMRG